MPYIKIVERDNGTKSRVMLSNFAMPGFKPDVKVDVFKQIPGTENWELCTQQPHERKAAMTMSRSDYLQKGRHPMFAEFSTAELLKIGVEAKFFGYTNPNINVALALQEPGGGNSEIGVLLDTGNGMVHEVPNLDTKATPPTHIHIGGDALEVETNEFHQIRVIDLPKLHEIRARMVPRPKPERSVEEDSLSPS